MATKPVISSEPTMKALPPRVAPPGPEGLTVDDYLSTPDDGKRYELIDGELLVSPAPRRKHQEVVSNLHFFLSEHVRLKKIGKVIVSPLDYMLDDHNVVQPDIIFLPIDHPQFNDMDNMLHSPPGLAVEVLSPSGVQRDLRVKFRKYLEAGVANYWVADPEREIIEAWSLVNRQYQVSHKVADGVFCAPPFMDLNIELVRVFGLA